MAERRMFAKTIIDSDAFLDMPLSTQALYFHLSMRADDDGFINNPRKIQRVTGASDDDLRLLAAKNFIIPFESGVVVIKHWKIHNYIQKDRYKETVYQEEKAKLSVKDNNAYTLDTGCIHGVSRLEAQDRIEIDKDSIVEERIEQPRARGANEIISDFTDNPDLRSAIQDFIKMRKVSKKPMTDKAVDLMLKKLAKLSSDEDEQIEILNQSIEHNWQTVYPLDDKKPQKKMEADIVSHGWDYDKLQAIAEAKALQ